MKSTLICVALALGVHGCGRDDPAAGDPQAKAPIDEARQAEKASDAGKPLSDASLTQIVRSALESESSLDARKIDIENRNGNVALHGSVASDEQREKAARIVSAVGGVRDVQNNLSVDPSGSSARSAGAPAASAAPPAASAGASGASSGASATIPQRKD
jgi:hyperosmotically inducible protein